MRNVDSVEISVLMPVYNCEPFVQEAVESIINQTIQNFELIIIDDCSTDNTIEIIKAFNDPRITLILKEKNSGYTDSLNYGLTIAKGKYIARMDGDDISAPMRFEIQKNFLDQNLDYNLCGSFVNIIGEDRIIQLPTNHDDIKLKLIKESCIAHPSVMFRKDQVVLHNLNYNKEMEPAEDYDLWTKLILIGKAKNINKPLLHYRIHNNQISVRKSDLQRKNSNSIRRAYLKSIFGITSKIDDLINLETEEKEINVISNELVAKLKYWNDLERINKIKPEFPVKKFNHLIADFQDRLLFQFFQSKKKYTILQRMKTINKYAELLKSLGYVNTAKFYMKYVLLLTIVNSIFR